MIFYTRHGNTAKMAEAVAQGSRQENANVKLMRIADNVPTDIIRRDEVWYQKHQELEKNILQWNHFLL